jgi:Sel1 repeat
MWFIPGFLISIATFPGVIVHELAHVAFCKFTDTPVLKVCYFRVGNPAGYVIHEQPTTVWRHIMIGVGPFFVNTLLGFTIGIIAIPMHVDFDHLTPLQVLLLWLGVSIAMHSFPSTGDARSIWHAVWSKGAPASARIIGSPLVGIIVLGAIGSIFWLDALYGVGVVGAAAKPQGALSSNEALIPSRTSRTVSAGASTPMRAWPVVAVTPTRGVTHDVDVDDLKAYLDDQMRQDNLAEIKARADKGDPNAQLLVAEHYESGVGVERDYGEALKWARKAADQNDASGQHKVAESYAQGRGVEKDEAESLSWLLKAAHNGRIGDQIEVARRYYQGIGVKPNVVEAYAWLNVAAARPTKFEGLQRFAAKQRDGMEKQMTTTEVTAAQKRARELAALLELTHAGSPLPEEP